MIDLYIDYVIVIPLSLERERPLLVDTVRLRNNFLNNSDVVVVTVIIIII